MSSSLITPTIVLITGHFSNSAKFYGNDKIPRQRANCTARLEIPRPTENCGPYQCGIADMNHHILQLMSGKWKQTARLAMHCNISTIWRKLWKLIGTLLRRLNNGTNHSRSDNCTTATESTSSSANRRRWSYWRKVCMHFDVWQIRLQETISHTHNITTHTHHRNVHSENEKGMGKNDYCVQMTTNWMGNEQVKKERISQKLG